MSAGLFYSGPIPRELGGLSMLKKLLLSTNKLTGVCEKAETTATFYPDFITALRLDNASRVRADE